MEERAPVERSYTQRTETTGGVDRQNGMEHRENHSGPATTTPTVHQTKPVERQTAPKSVPTPAPGPQKNDKKQ